MLKLRHYFEENGCYFVTTTTEGRERVFANQDHAFILWNVINNVRARQGFRLLAFVIMPEHLHLLLMPGPNGPPSLTMREIKKGSARLINKRQGREGKVWMNEYYEYTIRDEKDLLEKVNYIHNNPVKRGLVQEPENYPFRSANPSFEPFLFREW